MAATPTKLSSEADVGRSKAQHVVILAFCSKIAGITYSASTNTALAPRLAAETGLNDGVFVNNLTEGVSNGKCRMSDFYSNWTKIRPLADAIVTQNTSATPEQRATVQWLILLADRITEKDLE